MRTFVIALIGFLLVSSTAFSQQKSIREDCYGLRGRKNFGQLFGSFPNERLIEQTFDACSTLAKQGDRRAQGTLASMYWDGIGTRKDTSKWLYWQTQAAQRGDILAMSDLGMNFEQSDPVQAYMWFSLAIQKADNFRRIRQPDEPDREEIPMLATNSLRELEKTLTKAQIAEAAQRTSAWLRQHP